MVQKINQYGEVVLNTDQAIDLLLSGYQGKMTVSSQQEIDQFEKAKVKCVNIVPETKNIDIMEYHDSRKNTWLMPQEYQEMDIFEYLRSLVKEKDHTIKMRVEYEIELYKKYNLEKVLCLMKYLIDIFKENNIVWGVGRGSSVSSYCLYLLEVHMVDSIKYNLDVTEFLRE